MASLRDIYEHTPDPRIDKVRGYYDKASRMAEALYRGFLGSIPQPEGGPVYVDDQGNWSGGQLPEQQAYNTLSWLVPTGGVGEAVDFAKNGFRPGTLKAVTGYTAPMDEAHRIAQKNAVDMLGLPPDNTAMDRAKAMGFDYVRRSQSENTPFNGVDYGMFAESGGSIDDALESLEMYGKGQWLANPSTNIGDVQKEILRAIRRDGLHTDYGTTAASLVRESDPESIVNSAGMWDATDLASSAIQHLSSNGVGGVRTNDGAIVWDPKHIRSRFAAFDPAKRDSADLLASLAAAGFGVNQFLSDDSLVSLSDLFGR